MGVFLVDWLSLCCLLSPREINKGDEIAWYADGDYTVRNEYNSAIAYGFGLYFCYSWRLVFVEIMEEM